MKNNKIVVLLALGLMLAPVVSLQAEDSSGANAGVGTSVDDQDKYPLPPVRNPDLKPPFSNDSTMGGPRSGLKAGFNTQAGANVGTDSTGLQMSAEMKAKIKANMEARRKEILEKLKERKGEIRTKLKELAKERVKKLLENIFKRLNNQLERLSKLDVRIGAKITALGTAGVDVTALNAQYAIAQTALAKAKVDVEAASSISIDQTSVETSKETLRSLVKTAEESIKAAGGEYRKVIALIPDKHTNTEVDVQSNSSTSVSQ